MADMQPVWGDEVVEDEYLPPRQETEPDDSGIKKIIEYRRTLDGKKERVTQTVKVIRVPLRTSDAIAERRTWSKFGAVSESKNEQNVTYPSYDEVFIEDPDSTKDADQSARLAEALVKAMEKAQNRYWQEKHEAFVNAGDEGPAAAGGGTGVYVPPSKRRVGVAGERERGREQEDTCTLRVSNLSSETRESDVEELFRHFGPIQRVYLARDRESGESRGFAFVSFHNRADAEKAQNKLNGYGYDHLILAVEWAKPSRREAGEGGLSGQFTSGYGKALPQGLK